jgi:hypothetical protein
MKMKRCVDPVSFLPNEFFDVREETTPKAPIKRLMFYAVCVYLVIGGSFGVTFYTQINQKIELRSTQILQAPIVSNEADTTITCSPLGIISSAANTPKIFCLDENGHYDKLRCDLDNEDADVNDAIYVNGAFIGPLQGVSVQYSEKGFQVTSVEHCNDLLPDESDWKSLNCGPAGVVSRERRPFDWTQYYENSTPTREEAVEAEAGNSCWLFIDFGKQLDSNYPASATILRGIYTDHEDADYRYSADSQVSSAGPYVLNPRSYEPTSYQEFQEFVLDREKRRWIENPNDADGSSGVYNMERYQTLKSLGHDIMISGPWYSTYNPPDDARYEIARYYSNGLGQLDPLYDYEWDWAEDLSYKKMSINLCADLFFLEQNPYSCETVKISHPTYLEATSVAYTTAGLVASVLIPITAFFAGKIHGKKAVENKAAEMVGISHIAHNPRTVQCCLAGGDSPRPDRM